MNHIHRLQQDIQTRDAVIQAALNGMADLRRYCESDKYAAICATMNPADVLLRLEETLSAMTDAEFNATRCGSCGLAAQSENGGDCRDCRDAKAYGADYREWSESEAA